MHMGDMFVIQLLRHTPLILFNGGYRVRGRRRSRGARDTASWRLAGPRDFLVGVLASARSRHRRAAQKQCPPRWQQYPLLMLTLLLVGRRLMMIWGLVGCSCRLLDCG